MLPQRETFDNNSNNINFSNSTNPSAVEATQSHLNINTLQTPKKISSTNRDEKETKTSSTPLSEKTKKYIIKHIEDADRKYLEEIVIEAALNHYKFPEIFNPKLENLQNVYYEHKDHPVIGNYLKLALQEYVSTTVMPTLNNYLPNNTNFHSELLNFLANKLNLDIHQNEPFVELSLHNCKVYWRIVKNNNVVYTRPSAASYEFKEESIIRMEWNTFRLFKDAGKRGGTVEITQSRFVNAYTQKPQQAAAIWQDLKSVGILTEKNRLSDGWRVISNASIHTYLYTKYGANCQGIVKTLYVVANNYSYKEEITEIPGACIYRSERALKSCAETGLVKNEKPKVNNQAAKLWDVSLYVDQTRHTPQDKGAIKFAYDHIPSTFFLKTKLSEYIQNYHAVNDNQKRELKDVECQIETKKNQIKNADAKTQISTRSATIQLNDTELKALEEKRASLTQKIADTTMTINQLNSESGEPGPIWWTIAIPDNLHKQGDTFQKSPSEQLASKETSFIKEITDYLVKLRIRAEEFSLTPEDCLKMIGALRYLYRCQTKQPTLINQKYEIGLSPYIFFYQNSNIGSELDKIFTKEIKFHLDRKENSQQKIKPRLVFIK